MSMELTVTEQHEFDEMMNYCRLVKTNADVETLLETAKHSVNEKHPLKLRRREFLDSLRELIYTEALPNTDLNINYDSDYSATFSEIYIENKVCDNEMAKNILSHFNKAEIKYINHYKDIFTPAGQDIISQKKNPALILASKEGRLIYKGSRQCEDFGNDYFYYTSSVMNCCYDCEYCYLLGMYPSGNVVVFVNLDDIFSELEEMLNDHPVYLCISYDTDLLALEGITGYVKRWIEFTNVHNNLTVECRTKSANIGIIEKYLDEGLCIPDRFIFAWTLSPDEISRRFEHKAPAFSSRLGALKRACELDLSTRICLDPVLLVDNYETLYSDMIKSIFTEIDSRKISDVSLGGFRIPKNYLTKMRKARTGSLALFPYINTNNSCSYGPTKDKRLTEFVFNELLNYIPKEKIFVWKESS